MTRLGIPRTLRGLIVALALGLSGLAAAPAHADTRLPAPTGLEVLHVTDTTADMYWSSSCYSTGDVVQRYVSGSWQTYATGSCEYLALTGLAPGTTYTFRVYSAAVPDIGYAQSPPSAAVSFTTLSGPDTVPPSKPGTPSFSGVTTTVVNVFWGQSTDNVQVAGYYLQELVNGTWTTIRTVAPSGNSQGISGLSPSTSYTFAAIAFDARGNTSTRSDPGTVTTLAITATPSCQANLQVYGGGGFTLTANIVNTTASDISGWSFGFSLVSTASVGSVFNSVLTRSGNTGTITAASYDGTIGQGGSLLVGFTGTAPAATPPSGFSFDGVPCTGA
ncbi:cellulose binding domain-containing protein [Actinospica robiniae]|uniref:cellulose binding domain-containing protein n=1 Tax=Actinospica robiniae TaxID=304901 RepID=UPI000550D2CB|nr:cellulose binding domain-containing protein [Actinospica robiniae]